ncbi:MAG: hypothetical protein QGI10_06235, partial [Vicinamibacterales bacterium]|nr:hypothetical protein [Vicinamibacterales bacterium]
MSRRPVTVAAIALGMLGVVVYAAPAEVAGATQVPVEHVVPSRPETLSWGWFPLDKAPVLTIASGETVRIDTLSHAGSTQRD